MIISGVYYRRLYLSVDNHHERVTWVGIRIVAWLVTKLSKVWMYLERTFFPLLSTLVYQAYFAISYILLEHYIGHGYKGSFI